MICMNPGWAQMGDKFNSTTTTWMMHEIATCFLDIHLWNMDKSGFLHLKQLMWKHKVESLLRRATENLTHSCWLMLMPTTPNPRLHFFHSHNCLPRPPVSMLGELANKTADNVSLPSCWTVVDCDWLIKCKHLFRLYSHLTMPDIFSCAGTALRVWSVGSVERSMALWDFFFTARNMGAGRYLN